MEGTLATISMFAGNFAPVGWALCSGQLIAISQNTALFSLLGTTYGGNGQTTFALPDLRSRVPMGAGQGPGLPDISLGEQPGAETSTLLVSNIPAHTHTATVTVGVSSSNATLEQPSGNTPSSVGPDIYAAPGAANGALSGTTLTIQPSSGGSQPFNLMQPVLCVTFVICTQGVFPARN